MAFEIKKILIDEYGIQIQSNNYNECLLYSNECVAKNFYSKESEIDVLFKAFEYIVENLNIFKKD